jgi:peroxiredoxin
MSEEAQPLDYNNARFKVKLYNFEMFVGPAAGEEAPDFSVTDLKSGEDVKLSDFRGKWTVVETGSSTCSMYTKNIARMKEVVDQFDDVEFLLIYVREAHPGERLHQHKSIEEKKKAAALVAPRYGEHRRVLVDTFEGDFHRAYGGMPNIVYIIRPDGTVHYRCNWTSVDLVRDALNDRENLHTLENAPLAELRATRGAWNMFRTMYTGGILALWDFVRAGPEILKKHHLVDAYYEEHGRFKNSP